MKCVYGVNEIQCNRCKILNQGCITLVAKNAWKKKQDYRNEKKTRDAKNGASDNNLLSPP